MSCSSSRKRLVCMNNIRFVCCVLLAVILWGLEGSCSSSSSSSNNTVVRDVLRAFKQAMITSDPLHALASWDVSNYSSSPCSWAGLHCNNRNQLISLVLSNKSLHGSLSPQLSLLPHLSSLDLSHNNLSSSLPSSLPPSLSSLDLSYNSLSGSLPPSSLANLSSLRFLSLDNNFFSGHLTLPPSCLPHLSFLSLVSNSFSGPLPPQLPLCPSLQIFNVSHNFFTGSLLPTGIGNLTTLTHLDLGVNNLQGPIPPGLGNCSLLQFLSLTTNNFSGAIPPSLGLCTNLQFLSLFLNNGSGAFPPEIGSLSKLSYISLGYNRFTGKILEILANCSELTNINLANNPSTGGMPPNVGSQLPNLQVLVLEMNAVTGSIPASLGNCSSLTLLIIGFNNISGTIPEALFRSQQLIQLDLQHNALSGSLPPQIGNLTLMQKLLLNNNRFTGSLPHSLGLLASIQVATFEYNSFSGNFPAYLFNCSTLMGLSVHDNHLQGTIPSSIGHLTNLEGLQAQNNMLTGFLPQALSNCTKLQSLILSNNMLTGEINGSVVATLLMSIHFDLSDNNLSGPIPEDFGAMIHLQTLDLSYNKLSGPVPPRLAGCVSLLYLNLSGNELNGTLPSLLGTSLLSLLSLNLSRNTIGGSIPKDFGNLTSLQQLDLSYNALSGTIPSTLAGIRALSFLNLSYNSLEGTVPYGGVFSNLTSASFLGNPRLCGHIVNKICAATKSSHALGKLAKIGLAVASLFIAGIGYCTIAIYRKKASATASLRKDNIWDFTPFLRIKLEDIQQATNNFSEENTIGTGVTGTVYKGVMTDGRTLAFKRFTFDNTAVDSFVRELQSVGSIRHRNLIRILGYCSDQLDTNILILEYMPNRSLNDHLHQQEGGGCKLSWQVRLRVAIDVAQGLLYLHYDCPAPVIHCDLKPHNVLFDSDMEVRISDFGLAKVMAATATSNYTENMQGTLGYMAPELASYGHISRKCDVYSYGILVMELVSGRRPAEELGGEEGKTLVQWVQSMVDADNIVDIVDETLRGEYSKHKDQMKQLLSVALQCTQENPRRRPTMQQVMQMLLSSPLKQKS